MSEQKLTPLNNEDNIPTGKAVTIILIVGLVLMASIFLYRGTFSSSLNFLKKDLPNSLVEQNIIELTKQVKANPDDPQGFVELGWAYFVSGDKEQAKTAYQQALSLDKEYIPAMTNMGILLLEDKKYTEAKNYFLKITKLNPNHELARFNLGIVAIKMEDKLSAIKHLEFVTKFNPNSGDAWYYLGLAYEKNNNIDKAIKAYKKALTFLPDHDDAKKSLKALQENGGN